LKKVLIKLEMYATSAWIYKLR